MRSRNLTVLSSILLVLVLAGCASAPEREISREVAPYATLQNGNDPLNPDRLSPYFKAATSGIEEGVIPYYESKRGHALNVLTISGGGQNGAFGAGFLIGWRESGRRPEFDIVTGVSTGALLATHAFLGTPADDAVLEELYTQITKDDIYRNRGSLSVALGANSLKDTAPLAALIAKYITAEVLERVAAAYDDNRRLWVGTTNIDYDQTWVWNLTLIAKEGGRTPSSVIAKCCSPRPRSPSSSHRWKSMVICSSMAPPERISWSRGSRGGRRRRPRVRAGQRLRPYNGRLEHPPHTVPRQAHEPRRHDHRGDDERVHGVRLDAGLSCRQVLWIQLQHGGDPCRRRSW